MANDILDVISVFFSLLRWNVIPIYEELTTQQSIDYVRILIAAFAGSSSAGFLVVYFREKIHQIPLLFCRDHVVICGQNDTSAALVRELTSSGTKSVTITTKDESQALADIRRYGTVVLSGNAKDPAVLSLARLKSAKTLLALTDSDGYNAEIAVSAMSVLEGRRREPLSCILQIHNPGLWRIIREQALFHESGAPIRLDFYNGPAIAARVLLNTHFTPYLDSWLDTPSLLIVVGAGKLGESVITRASREWFESAPPSSILHILLVDLHATEILDRLLATYPHLKDAIRVTPRSVDVQSAEFQSSDFFRDFGKYSKALAFICLNDDTAGLTAALTLSHHLNRIDSSILVRMDHNPGLARLVGERSLENPRIIPFSSLTIASGSDLVLGGVREILAKAIHAQFLVSSFQGHAPIAPDGFPESSRVPWDNLPDRLKDSNRNQADGIMEKLWSIGCDIMPMTDWGSTSFSFSSEEIERLAEMEHNRWMAEMENQGFRFGSLKDSERRTHTCMVPFKDLPEQEKEKDRETVRMIPIYLALIDFQVYRRLNPPG